MSTLLLLIVVTVVLRLDQKLKEADDARIKLRQYTDELEVQLR